MVKTSEMLIWARNIIATSIVIAIIIIIVGHGIRFAAQKAVRPFSDIKAVKVEIIK